MSYHSVRGNAGWRRINICKSGITLHCTSLFCNGLMLAGFQATPLHIPFQTSLFNIMSSGIAWLLFNKAARWRWVCAACAIERCNHCCLTPLFATIEHLLRLNLNKSKQLLGEQWLDRYRLLQRFWYGYTGITSSRGTRNHNEDRYRAVTLELLASSHMQAMRRDANRAYFGVFDG